MNAARFKETLEYIEMNPAEWHQYRPNSCFLALANFLFGGLHTARWPLGDVGYEHTNPLGLSHLEYGWVYGPYRKLDDFRAFLAAGGIPV